MSKKIISYVLMAGILATSMPSNRVLATTEMKEEKLGIESIYRVGSNIESRDSDILDDRELGVSFDEFMKSREESGYKAKAVEERVITESGIEIIESNLKWNGDLNYSNKPKEIILHHIEASRPGQTIPVTDVHQWHLANGWAGIGYHFYVTKTGKIYRGRPENAIGAHAKNFNTDTLGIAVEGKYETETMPTAQRIAVEKLGGYLRGKYNINKVSGHGEKMPTSCPGKKYPLDGIRKNILSYPSYPEQELPSVNDIALQYTSFVQGLGWQQWNRDGKTSGTVGQAKRIENFKMQLSNAGNSKIKYRAHIEDYGWMPWVSNGEDAGVRLEGKQVEAIELVLEGEITEGYELEYRVHVEDYGWKEWTKSGIVGTIRKNKQVEAIEARLVKKNSNISYQTHVEDYGWQNWKTNGSTSGTSGEAKRLEGIKIKLIDNEEASIKYRTHVEDYGWMPWISNGELAGTVGEAKRLEAIEINIEGENIKNKKIEYRVHVEDYGWLPWVKNGELAGTVGEAKRLEAIEIKLVD